jgi:hypothetical protein
MMKPTKSGPHEVDPENVQVITRDQLKDTNKAEFEAQMKHYEEFCLASYGSILSKSPSQPTLKGFKT